MYRPVGVESAMLMSACGRSVTVGFSPEAAFHEGVMDERNSGHSSIAFDKVFRRTGRYVSLVNCADGSAVGGLDCG